MSRVVETSSSQEAFVRLAIDDTSALIRRKLAEARGERVYLIVPAGCRGLKNLVGYRLLRRASSAPMAIIAEDKETQRMARRAGFAAYPSLEEARRLWRPLPAESRAASVLQLRAKVPQALARLAQRPLDPAQGAAALLVAGGGAFVLVSLLGLILLPSASVTLSPVSYPVEETVQVTLDTEVEEIDLENLTLPARLWEYELRGQETIATSGRKDFPEEPATGEVVFDNRRSEATRIPAGTIVSTSGGTTIRFRTTQEVILDPFIGSRSRAPIEALEPGLEGNVSAFTINRVEGSLALMVNAINDQATSGGTVRQAPYVSYEDKDRLYEQLSQRLREEAIRLMAPPDEDAFLLPSLPQLIVLREVYDGYQGQESPTLSLDLRVHARVAVVRTADAQALALHVLESRIDEGFQLLPSGIALIPNQILARERRKITLSLTLRGSFSPRWAEQEIKANLAGKTIPDAVSYLQRTLELRQVPVVRTSPAGWPVLPWVPLRIDLEIIPGESP